jgi:phosphate transport system substrate-binding protein
MVRRNKVKLLLTIIPCLLVSAWVQAETLTWSGCGISKKAYVTELAKAFELKKGITVKVSGGGATKGLRQSASGMTDVGGSCRYWLKDVSGNAAIEEQGIDLVQVAWDALVVIVNPSNPVDNISMSQLRAIYRGKITHWPDLGGSGKRIVLVTRKGKTSGVGHMFRKMVFSDPDMKFKGRSIKMKSTGPLEKKVSENQNAMAIDGISSARKVNVKFLSVDGILPSKENISNGTYKLYRPLYLSINRKTAPAIAGEFIDFALSAEGQKIISEQGTVNLSEGAALVVKWEAKSDMF